MNTWMDPSHRPALVRYALAVTFAVTLLAVVTMVGTEAHWVHDVGTAVGFAAAFAAIAMASVEWERGVATAQSAGLVE